MNLKGLNMEYLVSRKYFPFEIATSPPLMPPRDDDSLLPNCLIPDCLIPDTLIQPFSIHHSPFTSHLNAK